MKSSFFEYNVAVSGLFTARAGLDTVSHNIANASTPGFSRQYIEQRATTPLMSVGGRGMVGTGSEAYGIQQMRDFYLDKKYWGENCVLGEYSIKRTQLSLTEGIFNEWSGTGLSSQFDDFFNRLRELSTTAGDNTYRTNTTQLTSSITTFFQNTYESFVRQQRDVNSDVKAVVDTINSIGNQISTLNKQIIQYEIDGSSANDLRDQRARLVDELSKYVNIEVKEIETNLDYAAGKYPNPEDRGKSAKHFVVLINGHEFVNHFDFDGLKCVPRTIDTLGGGKADVYYNPEDTTGLYDIYWTSSNSKFDVYHPNLTGELKGLIDVRDGNNGNYVRKSTFVGLSGQTLTLNIDLADSRIDLNPGGGVLTVTDPSTGIRREYEYESCTKTASGQFEFVIAKPQTLSSNDQAFIAAGETTIGKTTNYKGIPYYMSKLNQLARTFAVAMNEGKYMDGTAIQGVIGHVDGYDANGENLRTLLFTYADELGNEVKTLSAFDVYKITANNFFVNTDLMRDPRLLAAAQEPAGTGGISDNNVILSLSTLATNPRLFLEGNIKDYIVGITGELGINLKQAVEFEASYKDVSSTINNQRLSVSGVSLDEEMINMIKYNQQYQAAAKLMNVIDDIYNTTINNLGAR